MAQAHLPLHYILWYAPSASTPLLSTIRGLVDVNLPCRKHPPQNTRFYKLNHLSVLQLRWTLLWYYTSIDTCTRETARGQEQDCFLKWMVTLGMSLLHWEAWLEENKGVWIVKSLSLWSYHPWGHVGLPNINSHWSIPWLQYHIVFMTPATSPYYTHKLKQLYF